MMSSAKLIKDVQKWGYERGITEPENAHMQTMKTIEETGELASSIAKYNRESAVDAFGDILVTMIMHNECLGGKLDFILLDGIENPQVDVPDVYTAMCEFTAKIGSLDYYTAGGMYDRVQALEVLRRATADHLNCENFPTLLECLQIAYDEIKDRKGKMQGGAFVKEADLPINEEPAPVEEKAELEDEESKAVVDALDTAVGNLAATDTNTETSRVIKRKSHKKKDAE